MLPILVLNFLNTIDKTADTGNLIFMFSHNECGGDTNLARRFRLRQLSASHQGNKLRRPIKGASSGST